MTITRLWQAGGEWVNTLIEFTSRNSSNFTIDTEPHTGDYSFRTSISYYGTKVLDTTYDQLRLGAFVYHQGVVSGDSPTLFMLLNGGTQAVDLRWDGDNSTLQLYVGATQRDSVLSATFAQTETWMHIGVDVKLAASGGWVKIYLDGVETLSYEGDTTGGASVIDTLIVGSPRSGNFWSNYLRVDDIYIESTAGESSAAAVPDYRFEFVTPNGNGTQSQWDGSDGNSTDNYSLMGVPHDGDTSYVETDVSGEGDDYTMSNITLPTGYVINAVIGGAVVKKLDAAGTLQLKLKTRAERSATPYFVSGAAQALGTDYALYWERRTAHPDSGLWDETTVNTLQIGVVAN